MLKWRLIVCSVLLVGVGGSGCRSVQDRAMALHVEGASGGGSGGSAQVTKPSGVAGATDSIWPSRWGNDEIQKGDRVGVIVELDHPVSQLVPAHLSRFHQLRSGETEYQDAAALAGGMKIDQAYKFRAEGPGSYLFVNREPERVDDEAFENKDNDKNKDNEPALAFKFISAQQTGTSDPTSGLIEDQIELERTWFTYRVPIKGKESVGTLVLMPGMFGTPEPVVDATERYFRAKGWSVIRMLSHPSGFTARRSFSVLPGSEAVVASEIAKMFDTRAAECAYAVSAAVGFVHERFADNAKNPVVLLGMSGGAMVLPTVYAFDPSLYSGGVLIAGGGNFLGINIHSNYAKWIDAMDLDADPDEDGVQKPEAMQLQEMMRLYMESSRLDSLHTASQMQSVPVLMLHASSDKAVPAGSGDALHRALGNPERWVYPVGHELIFAALPLQIPKIEKWVGEHVFGED